MRKIKVLALVMVFAFAALGGAYAYWYDSLFINESVNTGVVDLQWQCINAYDEDYYGDPDKGIRTGDLDETLFADPDDKDFKNVAKKTAELVYDEEDLAPWEGEETDLRAVDDVLLINLFNAYPGYTAKIDACVVNKGTVPTKFIVSGQEGIPEWLTFKVMLKNSASTVIFDSTDGTNLVEGYQLDPGDKVFVTIYEEVLQGAPQSYNGSFEIQLQGIQWNGYVGSDNGEAY